MEIMSKIKTFGPMLAKFSEFMGEAGGWMNWLGVGPGRRSQHPAEGATKSEGKPIEVNSWGPQDEEGILYLLSKYGIPKEVLKEGLEPVPVSLDENRALGLLFSNMSRGEMDAFKRIIARGNEQPITVKVPVPVKLEKKNPKTGEVIATEEKLGSREYTVFAALRGSHILRSIGQDILKAGEGKTKLVKLAACEERAEALANEFRDLGILKNWPDLAKKVWTKIKEAKPGTGVYALRQEAYFRWRLGNEGYDYIYRGARAQAFQVVIDRARTPATKAVAERRYWDYFGAEAARIMDPAVQREAARAQGIIHPNKLLWGLVGGIMGFILIGFAVVIVLASIN